MKYLGDTLEQIAGEKAWIAKPGAPFVIGEREPELVEVLRREARRAIARHAPESRPDIRVLPPEYEWSWAAQPGRSAPAPQRRGRARSPDGAPGAATVRSSTRSTARSPRRGSPAGSTAGASGCSTWRTTPTASAPSSPPSGRSRQPRPIHALVSILGDKEWPEMLVQLDRVIDQGVLTVAPTAAGRGWDTDWLRRWLRATRSPAGPRGLDPGPGLSRGAGGGAARAPRPCW